jgi:uncharacterized protein
MKHFHCVAFILVLIGALNWLLVGIGVGDVVSMIFGAGSIITAIIFVLVGLSGVYLIVTHKKYCKKCDVA